MTSTKVLVHACVTLGEFDSRRACLHLRLRRMFAWLRSVDLEGSLHAGGTVWRNVKMAVLFS
jgi:hypothetical protein